MAVLRFLKTHSGAGICLLVIFILVSVPNAQGQKIDPSIEKQTFIYATKDSNQLALDVYRHKTNDLTIKKPCVIFMFGGAFVGGRRDDTMYNNYFNRLVQHDCIVVPITYRLGLKGVKHLSIFNVRPLKNAIDMAVDDVFDATMWMIANADKLGIDTSKIILSGSSSGAITALESDFVRKNEHIDTARLPPHFQYAGVIAFSGAILSFNGRLKYARVPAPTMMFHGTADKIVPYKKIRFFNKGFYGSSWIAKTFKEEGYPYFFFSVQDLGHEVSVGPMIDAIPQILDFIDKFVMQQKPYQISIDFKDPDAKPLLTMTAKELFEKLEHK